MRDAKERRRREFECRRVVPIFLLTTTLSLSLAPILFFFIFFSPFSSRLVSFRRPFVVYLSRIGHTHSGKEEEEEGKKKTETVRVLDAAAGDERTDDNGG